jgi:hypothetical protein
MGLKFTDIINEINALQSNLPSNEKKVLLESDLYECRVVFHLQIPRKGAEKLVALLQEALKILRKN